MRDNIFFPETDADYSLRLLSLEDDPTLRIFTFRVCFLSLGLSCFAAVLGQIFVSSSGSDVVSAS
jgi:hypothetical protein